MVCEAEDHVFKLIVATPWEPQVSAEDQRHGGRIVEERQELIGCKQCGHLDALVHTRPIGTRPKDEVGTWRAA
jgi:hypothetical protein